MRQQIARNAGAEGAVFGASDRHLRPAGTGGRVPARRCPGLRLAYPARPPASTDTKYRNSGIGAESSRSLAPRPPNRETFLYLAGDRLRPLASNLGPSDSQRVVPTSRASEPDCTSSLRRCALGLYISSQRLSSHCKRLARRQHGVTPTRRCK